MLMGASGMGNEVMVAALLQRGASVNLQNKRGDTALMVASFHGNEAVVAALLKRGASVNLQNKHGGTALMLANHPAVVRRLLSRRAVQQGGQHGGRLRRAVGPRRRREAPP